MVAILEKIDLDYDDNLEADAEAFGQHRGYADQLSLPLEPTSPVVVSVAGTLEEALYIARDVYGETNSEHSEAFFQWVQAVLEGSIIDIKVAEEMLSMLHGDRESFGARVGWKTFMQSDPSVVVRLRARRQASICAMNIVRAVLNKARGRCYMQWVQRSLWRATQTEKDVKSER